MQLVEFTACWTGNYTPEQEEHYKMMHGDDRECWPKTDDRAPIVLDIDLVCRFNPHHDDEKTTVELAGGLAFCIVIPYDEFKDLMEHHGHPVRSMIKTKTTHALPS